MTKVTPTGQLARRGGYIKSKLKSRKLKYYSKKRKSKMNKKNSKKLRLKNKKMLKINKFTRKNTQL
jgi:hypothetical protein